MVGRMPVSIDREWNPLPRYVALEAVYRGDGPLILVEPGQHPAARIIDVGHQHTPGPAPLEQKWPRKFGQRYK